jgi:hypothetical protein
MKKTIILGIFAITLLISACEKAIDYNTADIPNDFAPLAKPATGEGYQMHIPAFPIPANFEREWFMRVPLGNTEDIYVTSFEAKMRNGTHHLIAYAFEDENAPNLPKIGVMRDQNNPNGTLNFRSNMVNMRYGFGAPTAESKFSFPDGYAIKVKAGASFDMNSHYFNKTEKMRFGEVYVNFYTTPKEKVKKVLTDLFWSNYDAITLAPNSEKVMTQKYSFEKKTRIHQLTSHTHKRGTRYEIRINGGARDGEVVYVSEDWEHPPVINYTQPFILNKGEGLTSVVTFKNDSSRTIGDGVTSEDEMNIIIGYIEEIE